MREATIISESLAQRNPDPLLEAAPLSSQPLSATILELKAQKISKRRKRGEGGGEGGREGHSQSRG
jgi:hypothetical protein